MRSSNKVKTRTRRYNLLHLHANSTHYTVLLHAGSDDEHEQVNQFGVSQHDNAYAVESVIRQVNGGCHDRLLGLRNPLTDSPKIWHFWLRPPSDPTCKIWWLLQRGSRLERWMKLYLRELFQFSFFFIPSNHAQQSPRSVAFRWVHPEMCFVGGSVHFGPFCPCG